MDAYVNSVLAFVERWILRIRMIFFHGSGRPDLTIRNDLVLSSAAQAVPPLSLRKRLLTTVVIHAD